MAQTLIPDMPNSIEHVAERYSAFYPGYDQVTYFEAGMPIYKVHLKVSTLQDRNLSIVSEFVLRMVDSGVTRAEDIALWLGINVSHVYSSAAQLLTSDILSHDETSRLTVSPKGRDALNTLSLKVPQVAGMSIMVDALTGTVEPWTTGLLRRDTLKKLGLAALPPFQPKPAVSTLPFSSLKSLVRQLKRDKNDQAPPGDLLDLVSVDRVYVEYRKMYVLVYQEQHGENFEFLVLDRRHRMDEHEQFLRRLERSGVRIVPSERERSPQPVTPLPLTFDLDAAQTSATRYTDLQAEQRTLVQRLDTAKLVALDAEFPDDAADARAKVLDLEERLRDVDGRKVELDSTYRTLSPYENRAMLARVFAEARDTVTIVAPSLKRMGLNDDLLSRMEVALQRGVHILIGYESDTQQDRSHQDGYILEGLTDIMAKKHGKGLIVKRGVRVPYRCVICDQSFLTMTGFDFLPFRADPNRPLLQERGIYCGVGDHVAASYKEHAALFPA